MIGERHRKERGTGVKQQRLLRRSFFGLCGNYATSRRTWEPPITHWSITDITKSCGTKGCCCNIILQYI